MTIRGESTARALLEAGRRPLSCKAELLPEPHRCTQLQPVTADTSPLKRCWPCSPRTVAATEDSGRGVRPDPCTRPCAERPSPAASSDRTSRSGRRRSAAGQCPAGSGRCLLERSPLSKPQQRTERRHHRPSRPNRRDRRPRTRALADTRPGHHSTRCRWRRHTGASLGSPGKPFRSATEGANALTRSAVAETSHATG